MTREIIETPCGVGLVQRTDTGEVLRPMQYRLVVYDEMVGGTARKQVTGHLRLSPFDDVFGVPLRLTLDDGRNIAFFVAGEDGVMAVLSSAEFPGLLPKDAV